MQAIDGDCHPSSCPYYPGCQGSLQIQDAPSGGEVIPFLPRRTRFTSGRSLFWHWVSWPPHPSWPPQLYNAPTLIPNISSTRANFDMGWRPTPCIPHQVPELTSCIIVGLPSTATFFDCWSWPIITESPEKQQLLVKHRGWLAMRPAFLLTTRTLPLEKPEVSHLNQRSRFSGSRDRDVQSWPFSVISQVIFPKVATFGERLRYLPSIGSPSSIPRWKALGKARG